MTRNEKIIQIINQRKPRAQKIQATIHELKTQVSQLQKLGAFAISLSEKSKSETVAKILVQFNTTVSDLVEDIKTELEALKKLKHRFDRPTLNIGVVGRAGQGKSRFLQSLSGLTTAEIPSGDRGHCTGVRSTIYHKANTQTYGEVSFHSESSFLNEVVNPYYEALGITDKPQNLEEFGSGFIPYLPQIADNAILKAIFEHLERYKENLPKYRHLLRHTSPIKISQGEIREYVAQDTPDGERTYFNYLAVKEAKIFCNFRLPDVEKLTLIDMPGLGDTGLGDEERLINILGTDADIVLFIRMPRPPRDFWADYDVQLYETARSALTDLPIKDWSFLILNQTDANSPIGDNSVYCQDLAQSYERNFSVVDCLQANCADRQEANQKILDPVLQYLAGNIESLDRKYAATCQERINQLGDKINGELNKVHHLFEHHSSEKREFIRLFNELLNNLSCGLVDLRDNTREQHNEITTQVEVQVKETLLACKNNLYIPDEAEIKNRYVTPDGAGSYNVAYGKLIAELRVNLALSFLTLNEGLKHILLEHKLKVIETVIQHGRLGGLTEEKGIDFLKTMETLLTKRNNNLASGFRFLWQFELSYEAYLLRLIRQHLEQKLTPDTHNAPASIGSPLNIKQSLELARDSALTECQKSLEKWVSEPAKDIYCMVSEFVDHLLYARGVEDEWRAFLEQDDIRPLIWEEFEQLEQWRQYSKKWKIAIEAVIIDSFEKLNFSQ